MISAETLRARREKLKELLPQTVIVVTAYDEMQLSGDMAAPFRQQSAFSWLTNITSPGWKYFSIDESEYLVQPELTESQVLFDGAVETDAAIAVSGVENIIDSRQADELLVQAANEHDKVYTLGKDPYRNYLTFTLNTAQARLDDTLGRTFKEVEDCWPLIRKQMAVKDDAAIAAVRQAIAVSEGAFHRVKRGLEEARYSHEYAIEAALNHEFRVTGAQGPAYETIVASGKNACTLHYVENNDRLPENGLVLIDAGAMHDGYAADITRTYAVGIPTERQRAVHAAVENAHQQIIALLKPGLLMKRYQESVDSIMKEALDNLGLLDGPAAYRNYFPHAISHGLGLDVHESLGGHEAFEPGMILTVEPGIYIPEEGIGVRIEDDILITADGHENLSGGLPTAL